MDRAACATRLTAAAHTVRGANKAAMDNPAGAAAAEVREVWKPAKWRG